MHGAGGRVELKTASVASVMRGKALTLPAPDRTIQP